MLKTIVNLSVSEAPVSHLAGTEGGDMRGLVRLETSLIIRVGNTGPMMKR